MSRPAAPLEIYIARPEWPGGQHHASLYDPDTGNVLMTAQEHGHDAALERLLAHKKYSKVARRRYVIKSNVPASVQGLLELIDLAESKTDLETHNEATHIPLPIDDFIARIRKAIAVLDSAAVDAAVDAAHPAAPPDVRHELIEAARFASPSF